MKPDWNVWKKKKLWTIFEAASLYCDKLPPSENQANAFNKKNRAVNEMYDHLKNALDLKDIKFVESRTGWIGNRRIKPSDFVDWLRREDHPVPTHLSDMSKAKPLTERERTTYNNIIGALLDVILGKCSGIPAHPSFSSEADLIDRLIDKYYGKPGMSKSNLERKFPVAKRHLKSA